MRFRDQEGSQAREQRVNGAWSCAATMVSLSVICYIVLCIILLPLLDLLVWLRLLVCLSPDYYASIDDLAEHGDLQCVNMC